MRTRRAMVGLVAMIGGAALVAVAPAGAQPAPGTTAAATAADKITVTQTALAPITTCTTPDRVSTKRRLTIRSASRCRPRRPRSSARRPTAKIFVAR